jgi:hypothetical protein
MGLNGRSDLRDALAKEQLRGLEKRVGEEAPVHRPIEEDCSD